MQRVIDTTKTADILEHENKENPKRIKIGAN